MRENSAVCFLNSSTTSHCPSCSYGPLCQFTTAYYGITSFQAILCSIEHISIGIIVSIFLLGTVLNLLAIGTFSQPNPREVGSGIYRLWISIIGQFGLVVLVSHILLEKSNSERISCYILEYLRKTLHALYDSLTACTSIERTLIIYQGLSFKKSSSRRVAKLVIPILILYHSVSNLYQPFHRQVIYSFNRYWCVLKIRNHSILNYESVTNIIQFLLPYLINSILPLIWICSLTKSKSTLHKVNYMLVLFNTPRFISMFTLTCIQQPRQNTAYIMAYLLSLVPLLINLIIFILPSPKYRPELLALIQRIVRYRNQSQYNVA